MKCALCKQKDCYTGKDCPGIAEEIRPEYEADPKILRSMEASTAIESEFYMKMTRLEETMEYARRMGYHSLGLAFCIGMAHEAKLIHDILSKEFEVHSVCCKVCGIDKNVLGLKRLHGEEGIEAMCNPIGQAEVLNRAGTGMNIILGLCIGHDIIFTDHSRAPVTTLAVKDRVLGHNPLAAIYSGYYLKNRFGMKTELPEETK
ncbi:MAG: DUF1847 domain-containing protein [Thermoplasmata archaeon]|nr:DUF1847 domain-containing protein [Thermoplasmata archaeon]